MKLKLIKKITEAKNTKSFFWESEKKLNFFPGQYIYYTLPKLTQPDKRGATRHFTIASSPTEEGGLRLTTRIRPESGYKISLDKLDINSVIDADGPTGTFVFDESMKNSHVFLVGGIGITPFRSFIKYNLDKNLNIPMHLIYSNSDSDFVFKKELDSWTKENKFITIKYIDTSKDGRLNEDNLPKFLTEEQLKLSTFWIVGPPAFVSAMEDVLNKLKIKPERIMTEKFTGY